MKPLWKVKGFCNRTSWRVSDVQIVRYNWVLSFFSVSVSFSNRTIWAKVSLKIAETEQPYQVKRMIGRIGDLLLAFYSQTRKWERSKSFFGEPLKHVITPRWQILVSRTGDDSPCVHSKRPRVYVQNVPVCTGTTRTC